MFDLMGALIKHTHEIIINKNDTVTTLDAIDESRRSAKFFIYRRIGMEIGSCDWLGDTAKWFVKFRCTDNQWKIIIKHLNKAKRKILIKEDNRIYLE